MKTEAQAAFETPVLAGTTPIRSWEEVLRCCKDEACLGGISPGPGGTYGQGRVPRWQTWF